jgi:hypothetical protein
VTEPRDPQLRAFLLGALPPEESERIEELMVERQDMYEEAMAAEDDLLDEYAAGRLSAEERAAVEKRLPTRLAFAHALARAPRETNVVPFRSRTWWPLAAAAALVIAIGGYWFTSKPAAVTMPSNPPVAQVTKRMPVIATAVIAIASTRGDAASNVIDIPANAEVLNLEIDINPKDVFPRYTATIRDARGNVAFTGDATQSTPSRLLVEVPATNLAAGTFEVAVTGAPDTDLGFQTVEIRRPR